MPFFQHTSQQGSAQVHPQHHKSILNGQVVRREALDVPRAHLACTQQSFGCMVKPSCVCRCVEGILQFVFGVSCVWIVRLCVSKCERA